MVVNKPIGSFASKVMILFLWVILPLFGISLIVLMTVKFIIRRRQKAVDTSFAEEPAAPGGRGTELRQEDNLVTQGVMVTVSTTRDVIPTQLLQEI